MAFYTYPKRTRGETVINCLQSICFTEDLSDVYFIFPGEDNTQIPAHKLILALRSPVFKTMLYGCYSRSEEIKVLDINSDIFKIILRYLYTDQLELSETVVTPLLHAAQRYQLTSLTSCCEEYLINCLHINNACTIYGIAKSYSLNSLKQHSIEFISDNAENVFESEDFLSLSSENLNDLLRMDSLCISEIKVFNSVLKWADNSIQRISNQFTCTKSRRDILLQDNILYQIGIPLLSVEEYTQFVIPSGILTDEEQLYVFKAITMKDSSAQPVHKFRSNPRAGCVTEINIDQILPQKFTRPGMMQFFGKNNMFVKTETIQLVASKNIRIVAINISAKYQGSVPDHVESMVKCSVNGRFIEEPFKHGHPCKLKMNEMLVQQYITEVKIEVRDNLKPNTGFNFEIGYRFETTEVSSDKLGPVPRKPQQWHQYVTRKNTTLNFSFIGAWLVNSIEIID